MRWIGATVVALAVGAGPAAADELADKADCVERASKIIVTPMPPLKVTLTDKERAALRKAMDANDAARGEALRKCGESVEQDVFSFMTTTPNALVATINHQRMPVLLTTEADFATWLGGSPEEAFALDRSSPLAEGGVVAKVLRG